MQDFAMRKNSTAHVQLDGLVEEARSGDEQARSDLLVKYMPFILRVASQVAKRYIHRDDEEFSIAMLAMNTAIDSFDPDRNASFLSFAEQVIRRRLIDYFRSQHTNLPVSMWAEFDVRDDEDNVINYAEIESAVSAYAQVIEQQNLQNEIAEYAAELAKFGVGFGELVELAPKRADARSNAVDVAKVIVQDSELKKFVFRSKSLPLKDLAERVSVSRKTLERHRKYIIAIVVLLGSDYPYLRGYVH